MSLLNTDVLLHIGLFLDPQDVAAVIEVNREIRDNSDHLLRCVYHKTFGKINEIPELDTKVIRRLLCLSGRQPDLTINYNIYKTYLCTEVQDVYNRSLNLLENTQSTSIIQLKNKLFGFWHLDRQIKDYAEAASLNIGEDLDIGKNLESRSKETFAKIGDFNLNGKNYNVLAQQILADENPKHDKGKFWSPHFGKTCIGLFEREKNEGNNLLNNGFLNSMSLHNFSIRIGRVLKEKKLLSFEGHVTENEPVYNIPRSLVIEKTLNFRDTTRDVLGSDRLLDQKLTQIMIEMMVQNNEIICLKIDSNHDDLAVLAAAGFMTQGTHTEKIMEKIQSFRSIEENKLFPPYKNYGSRPAFFKMEDLTNQVVYFSKGAPVSWKEIIQREPILKEKSGILPEYWVVKPSIVERDQREGSVVKEV